MKKVRIYPAIKRMFDVILSFIGIILLSWLFVILIVLNLIATKGKPFYRDPRIGFNGKKIGVIKFTSMLADADENAHKYLNKKQMRQWKKERKVENDPRVTKFGKFLRKTSLDEIPQLFNIFAGSLSIVGPRPITERELMANFTDEEKEKLLSVKPGLTGNWAVHGRNNISYKNHERQNLELKYVDKMSFRTDVKIILQTVVTVFKFKQVK